MRVHEQNVEKILEFSFKSEEKQVLKPTFRDYKKGIIQQAYAYGSHLS